MASSRDTSEGRGRRWNAKASYHNGREGMLEKAAGVAIFCQSESHDYRVKANLLWVMMCAPRRGGCNGKAQCEREKGGSTQKAQGSRQEGDDNSKIERRKQENGKDQKAKSGAAEASGYSQAEKGTERICGTTAGNIASEDAGDRTRN